MLSDWLPWDFFRTKLHFENDQRVIGLHCYESYLEKYAKDNVKKMLTFNEVKIIEAQSMSVDWCHENMLTMSLFSELEDILYIVHAAENTPKNVQEFILNEAKNFTQNRVLLIFNKLDSFFQSMGNSTDISAISIKPHRFWEGEKLLELMMDLEGVKLDIECFSHVLESIENTPEEFGVFLNKLSLRFGPESQLKPLKKSSIEEVMEKTRWDNFLLAKLFSKKEFSAFFNYILERDSAMDKLEDLFRFLISHLLKMRDTSYVDKKARPSKYDKEIVSFGKLWKPQDIDRMISWIASGLLKIRKNDHSVWADLQGDLLKLHK